MVELGAAGKVFAALKNLPTTRAFVFSLVLAGTALALPTATAEALGVTALIQAHRAVLGIVFLASIAGLTMEATAVLCDAARPAAGSADEGGI